MRCSGFAVQGLNRSAQLGARGSFARCEVAAARGSQTGVPALV